MRKCIAIAALGLFAIRLQAEPELKGSPVELSAYLASVPKIVSITAEAELKVPADRALISLNVVTENKSLQEASRANQELRGRILRALTEQGFPAERIKASKFSSTPKYGVFKEKAKSYRVENAIKITVQDEKEFQAIAGVVDTVSEVRYDSVEFEHSDKDGLKARALAQAVDKASEKKKLYEQKLGVKLSPKSFHEAGTATVFRGRTVPYVSGTYYGGSPAKLATPPPPADGLITDDATSQFSELVYTARVTVEYAVESK